MSMEFEQQPKESDKAFAAFSMYLSLGSQRSIDVVASKLNRSRTLIGRWSSQWHWVDRVAAYNEHLAKVELEATEALARSKSAEWLTRQEKLRESEWEMHEKCVAAARKALEKFLEKDKVFATLSDIARILEIASKLGRLASGLATDKTELTGEDGGPVRVEITAALDKIYGVVAAPRANIEEPPSSVVEAEVIEEGAR